MRQLHAGPCEANAAIRVQVLIEADWKRNTSVGNNIRVGAVRENCWIAAQVGSAVGGLLPALIGSFPSLQEGTVT